MAHDSSKSKSLPLIKEEAAPDTCQLDPYAGMPPLEDYPIEDVCDPCAGRSRVVRRELRSVTTVEAFLADTRNKVNEKLAQCQHDLSAQKKVQEQLVMPTLSFWQRFLVYKPIHDLKYKIAVLQEYLNYTESHAWTSIDGTEASIRTYLQHCCPARHRHLLLIYKQRNKFVELLAKTTVDYERARQRVADWDQDPSADYDDYIDLREDQGEARQTKEKAAAGVAGVDLYVRKYIQAQA